MEMNGFVLEDIVCPDQGDGLALAEISFEGEERLSIPAEIDLDTFGNPVKGAVLPMELVGYVAECCTYENEAAYRQKMLETMERTGKKSMLRAECFSNIGMESRGTDASQCAPVAILGAKALSIEESWGDDLRPIYYVHSTCMGCPITLVVDSCMVEGVPREGNILHGIFILYAEWLQE